MAALLLLAVPGSAKETGDGFLIGVIAPYHAFAGHFDGSQYFNAGNELLLVPKLNKAFGYGVAVGGRRGDLDWELYYVRSSHDASWEDLSGQASFDAVGANSRFYLGRRGVIRPYANLGIDFCWLKAENMSLTTYAPIRAGEVKFNGIGLIGGLGVAISPVKAVTLYLGGEVRWNLFGNAKGVLGEKHKLDSLSSFGLGLRGGLVFVI
jgi:hypothetical protein